LSPTTSARHRVWCRAAEEADRKMQDASSCGAAPAEVDCTKADIRRMPVPARETVPKIVTRRDKVTSRQAARRAGAKATPTGIQGEGRVSSGRSAMSDERKGKNSQGLGRRRSRRWKLVAVLAEGGGGGRISHRRLRGTARHGRVSGLSPRARRPIGRCWAPFRRWHG